MRILRNRLAVGIMCIVLSLAVGFIGIPLMNAGSNEKVQVVRLKTDVAKGVQLTSEMLEVVPIVKDNLPEGIAKKKDEVNGLYAVSDMVKGEFIFSKKVSKAPAQDNEYLYSLPEGKMALSVTIRSLAAGLSGKLMPKDVVTIFSVEEEKQVQGQILTMGQNLSSKSYPELLYVEVLSVTASSGNDTDSSENKENSSTQADNSNNLPATVTLLANRQQAELLTVLEKKGGIHIGLVARGNETEAQKLLTMQEKLFAPVKNIQGEDANQNQTGSQGEAMQGNDKQGTGATQ